ncbi:hypothetical protein [Streptomyces sp. NPDC003952]
MRIGLGGGDGLRQPFGQDVAEFAVAQQPGVDGPAGEGGGTRLQYGGATSGSDDHPVSRTSVGHQPVRDTGRLKRLGRHPQIRVPRCSGQQVVAN